MRNFTRALVLGVALTLSGHVLAQDDIDALSQDELVERANQEGLVTWYVSVPATGSQPVADAFMAKYPGIRVDVQRLGGFGLWERISSEYAAGIHQADVYSQADFGVRQSAIEQGIIAQYIPPSAESYPEDFVDDDGYGFSTRVVTVAIAYNTSMVPEDKVPSSWADLLDPFWAGRQMGTSDPRASGFIHSAFWSMRNSEEIGEAWFEAFAEQDPVLFEEGGAQINSLVRGEYPLMILLDYRGWEFKEQGAPVDVVYPSEGVGWGVDYTHLVARAPNPHAARLFMDFYASQEGTELVAEGLRTWVGMPEVDTYPQDLGRPDLADVKRLPWDPQQQAEDFDELNAWFGDLFN